MKYFKFIITPLCLTLLFSSSSEYISEKVENINLDEVIISVDSRLTLKSATNRYTIRNLFDNNTATCWASKFVKSDTYDTDKGLINIKFKNPVYLKNIILFNGLQKSKELYQSNQRVKKIYIEKVIVGGRVFPLGNTFSVSDTIGSQIFSLEEKWTSTINLFKVEELIINIVDIYPSSKYEDICLSEIKFDLFDKPPYKPSMEWFNLRDLIQKNRTFDKVKNTWEWPKLYDKNNKLFNDLLYYALNNNAEAKQMIENYNPKNVGENSAFNEMYKKAILKSLEKQPYMPSL